MSRLQELEALKILLSTEVITKEMAVKTFIKVLDKHDSLYHFDDNAKDIIQGSFSIRLFSDEEAEVVDHLRDELYDHGLMAALLYRYNKRDKEYEADKEAYSFETSNR